MTKHMPTIVVVADRTERTLSRPLLRWQGRCGLYMYIRVRPVVGLEGPVPLPTAVNWKAQPVPVADDVSVID